MNQRIHPRTGKILPPYEVLDLAARLTDADVDGDEEIIALKNELAVARKYWQAEIKAFNVIRFSVDALPREVVVLQAEIAAINDKRPAVIAAALLGDGNFSADDELLKRRDALALRAERIPLALPTLERLQKEASNRVEQAGIPVMSLEERIAERLRELKLSEAERRCV